MKTSPWYPLSPLLYTSQYITLVTFFGSCCLTTRAVTAFTPPDGGEFFEVYSSFPSLPPFLFAASSLLGVRAWLNVFLTASVGGGRRIEGVPFLFPLTPISLTLHSGRLGSSALVFPCLTFHYLCVTQWRQVVSCSRRRFPPRGLLFFGPRSIDAFVNVETPFPSTCLFCQSARANTGRNFAAYSLCPCPFFPSPLGFGVGVRRALSSRESAAVLQLSG